MKESQRALERPRVALALVDDHTVVRQGLATLLAQLAPEVEVKSQAASADEALVRLRAAPHDLVLLDVSMPGRSGLDVLKDLLARWPELRVVMLSMHADFTFAERALRGGARGYVLKSEGIEVLVEAIRAVMDGRVYLSRSLADDLIHRWAGGRQPGDGPPVEQLTDREFEVFKLLGEGRDTREVGQALHISARTVETHRQNIRVKLGIKRTRDLYLFAARWLEQHRAG